VSQQNHSLSEEIVEPFPGRVVIFTSGAENYHCVERVTSGQRFVLAFWFTCDPRRKFQIFLDGKAHTQFSHQIKDQIKDQKMQESGTDHIDL
jgi:predicted 2-oxoglutarate/Fe(II)-dependent dioxygenase YbiX